MAKSTTTSGVMYSVGSPISYKSCSLTVSRLTQLNHGLLRTPVPGAAVAEAATRLRELSGVVGKLHVLDDEMNELPQGTPGTLWFETATPFEYFNDPQKTQEARSQDGAMSTVGDVGYLDPDGYLHLTDRATFMIISGGVNIYPQEAENVLVTHPKVVDVAVFGVPDDEYGEQVKAVVEPAAGVEPGPALERELIEHCRTHLATYKLPRSIDFMREMPREQTGKLRTGLLRQSYLS